MVLVALVTTGCSSGAPAGGGGPTPEPTASPAVAPKLMGQWQVGRSVSPLDDSVTTTAFPPANAIKATIPRLHGSGAVEDSDVYGAQQHGPLMDVEILL